MYQFTDGVVLVDPEYFKKEGKKDRKGMSKSLLLANHSFLFWLCLNCPLLTVFAQVLAGFRYGRDDLDVLGLNFRRDLIDVSRYHLHLHFALHCD